MLVAVWEQVGTKGRRVIAGQHVVIRLAHEPFVPLHDRLQHRNDVGRFGDWRRALLDQSICPFRARVERRARYGKHLAALFKRHPRGNKRAGTLRRLHNDNAKG